MSVAVEQAGIDYHVVLAQNALQQCLDQPELQSEFICALVKQTSRHTQQRLGVQVKKAARIVSLGTARVVSLAYCLTNLTSCTIFFSLKNHQYFLYNFVSYLGQFWEITREKLIEKMVHEKYLVKYSNMRTIIS